MIVAAAAVEREPHPHRADRLRLVEHILHPILRRDAPTLAIDHVIAIKARRQNLLLGRLGQQVPGDLLHGKPVVGLIGIECPHHPIAPRPHRALAVALIAVAVRVPSRLQPIPRHPLAITRRRQQPIRHIFKCRFTIFG